MSEQVDLVELDKFNTMVDNIVADLQSGKVKANPLEVENITSIDTSEIKVKSTATQKGEDEIAVAKSPNQQKFTGGKILIHNAETGALVHEFANASQAEKAMNIHQTTVRTYCKDNKTKNNLTWSYGG
jgi:hypothetical protein